MKIIYCKYNSKQSSTRNKTRFDFERFLFAGFIICFSIMVIVQIALISPDVRTTIEANGDIEGAPLGIEEYLFSEGSIELQLVSGDHNTNLKVLINGDYAGRFTTKNLLLKVKSGDVIELDASEVKQDAEVIILALSDNIKSNILNKRIRVNSNIKMVVKVDIG